LERRTAVWIKFKKLYGAKGRRVEWQAEWLPRIEAPKLRLMRGLVFEEYRRQWPEAVSHTPLGFVPSHVADPIITGLGLNVDALDFIMLRFAITQEIMIFDGTWESGPVGDGEKLTSPLPKSICGF
jgi:hypothetical protein